MPQANIFYFNPTCELAVANGSFSYMPPLLLQKMESDLAILPFVFGNSSDYVLTENSPSPEYILKLQRAGFDVPKFLKLLELESLQERALSSVQLWGWSPAAHFKLKKLKPKCTDEFNFNWEKEHQLLFERKSSLEFLKKLIRKNSPEWFISSSMIGDIVYSWQEVEERLMQHNKLVLKAPLSSSGRGIQIIRQSKLNESNKQWISGILNQQNYLIAEPLLEKVLDLSFQFHILSKKDIRYLGFSVFETNSNGQYKGTYIHPDLQQILPELDALELGKMLEISAGLICESLLDSVYSDLHRGYLGVDSMLFKEDDQIKIQPCVEINSRMNMGILTMLLEQKIHWEAKGKFVLFFGKQGEFHQFSATQSNKNPLEFKEGKLLGGFLPLVEPTPNKKFGAYINLEFAR
jgi:hypothetical protein